MFKRLLPLPLKPDQSFFLWGPRQAGKSTLLKATYGAAYWIDLLQTDQYLRFTERPFLLRQELLASSPGGIAVIDEIQKVPALLDEVHWLIENSKWKFCLCGSSARKLKRGHANLLGGRAIRSELFGLSAKEIGDSFDLNRLLNHGYLPRHYSSDRPARLIQSYVQDYLKEEIAAEGLVRKLPAFSNFLNMAALGDTELVSYSAIARECGVSSPAVKEYFQILVDTLLGRYLPSYQKRPKRRVILAPKFYFSDIGVVNHLAKRGRIQPNSELFGKAFENWIYHELSAHREYSESFYELSFWRTAGGVEVDFILNDMEIAIEAKASSKVSDHHLRSLREIKKDFPKVKCRYLVCLETKDRLTDDGIRIVSAKSFVERLWANRLQSKR